MDFIKLNENWNADPNAPEPILAVKGNIIIIDFYLNYFLFKDFKENDRGRLTFRNCSKYAFNGMNDEGYYYGQYRYKYTELPWGQFYQLSTDPTDFPSENVVLDPNADPKNLKHFLFFFRDNTFECYAESFEFDLIR